MRDIYLFLSALVLTTMTPKSSDEVRADVMRRYNKNPGEWRVWAGLDEDKNFTTIFINKGRMWVVKDFPINPVKSIGVGSKMKADENLEVESPHTFGLRPLNPNQVEDLVNGRFGSVGELLSGKPISEDEIADQPFIQGPVYMPNQPIKFSTKQLELDAKMRADLQKLIGKKYPEFFKSYR
ncbi:MAG: hypothetical protein ABH950_08380 [Candidatus Altiarchaeota archaeon]